MPVRYYECEICGQEERTIKNEVPVCSHYSGSDEGLYRSYGCPNASPMTEVLTAPNTKMLETIDADKGKTRLKDQMKILKERSRNHARDHEADELISLNRDNGIERSGFIRKDGKKRTKIDDL